MLKTRVITAAFLLLGFVCVLFVLPDWAAAFVFALVAALAAWEWAVFLPKSTQACPRRQIYAWLTLALCEALTFTGMAAAVLPALCLLAVVFWLLVVPFWFQRRWTLPAGIPGYLIGWLVILPTWVAMLDLYRRSPWLLLAAMALVWVADIAAYFCGRAFGKHKLAPTISPGKTREGAAGAIVAVLVYGFVVQESAALSLQPVILGLVLLVLTLLSIIGDLFESLLKRQANLKDSSQLLPGHGGVLDRMDSLTSTLPLVALYLFWGAA